MKRSLGFFLSFMVLALILGSASSLRAETFMATTDVGIKYNLKEGKNFDHAGLTTLGLALYGFGVGMTRLELSSDFDAGTTQIGGMFSNLTMVDVFYTMDFAGMYFTLGAGKGSSNSEISLSGMRAEFPDQKASQIFFKIGAPLLSFMEIHLGYSQIKADLAPVTFTVFGPPTTTVTIDPDASGTLYSMGLGVRF